MTIDPKALRQKMRPLEAISAGPGLRKTAACALLTLPAWWLGLTSVSITWILMSGVLVGVFHAAWLVTTHDAGHRTLTGWSWFDEIIPRVISYPAAWPHGLYTEIHKLHHRMNGHDLRDPERLQFTEEEYRQAPVLMKLYIRHQWVIDIFVCAGTGMFYKNFYHAQRFWYKSQSIRRAFYTDLVGIAVCATGMVMVFGWRYALMLLFIERISGAILQFRALIEHYGLWGKKQNFYDTQIHSCRNIRAHHLSRWFFNHLNYHSVHHAFPSIPFYQLPKAHALLTEAALLANESLPEVDGYLATGVKLATRPSLISVTEGTQCDLRHDGRFPLAG